MCIITIIIKINITIITATIIILIPATIIIITATIIIMTIKDSNISSRAITS